MSLTLNPVVWKMEILPQNKNTEVFKVVSMFFPELCSMTYFLASKIIFVSLLFEINTVISGRSKRVKFLQSIPK